MTKPVVLYQLSQPFLYILLTENIFEKHLEKEILIEVFQNVIAHRLNFVVEYRNKLAIFVNQEFCEIPFDRIFEP